MKKITTITIAVALVLVNMAFKSENKGDKYITKNGKVSFLSHTQLEDIKGDNNKVSSVLDSKSGALIIEVLIRSFAFKKALLEEHFNENYMESTTYPKSKFVGKIDDLKAINFAKDGTYKSTVSGKLTIKDKTNDVKTSGTFTVKDGKLNGQAIFKIKLADYNVHIKAVVKDKISEEIEISVDLDYSQMN